MDMLLSFNSTSNIPYVGGIIMASSIPGSQKTLKTKSIISSLPLPKIN